MKSQCGWSEMKRKRGIRFIILILGFYILLTGYPDLSGAASVFASEEQDGMLAEDSGEESVSGNSTLDNHISGNSMRSNAYTLLTEEPGAEETESLGQEELEEKLGQEIEPQSQAEAMWQTQSGGAWQQGSLAEAVAGVYSGGTVVLLSDVSLTGGITIAKPMTITSYDADWPHTIKNTMKDTDDRQNSGRIFTVTGGQVILQNIILDGGRNEGVIAYHPLICLSGQSAVLTMLDGTVLQNAENASPSMCGGGINIRIGKAYMYDGSKIMHCKARHGGGVEVNSNSKSAYTQAMFGIAGGIIENCEADNGGGVYINIGMLQMQGGEIRNNHATRADTNGGQNGGGGIYIAGEAGIAAVLIRAGKMIDNEAVSNGGGVLLQGGRALLQMEGGTIEGNTTECGGGVSIIRGNLKLYGGTVTGNTATLYGGGILGSPESVIEMKGNPKVFGNTAGDTSDEFHNIYLDGAEDYSSAWATSPIRLAGPLTEAVQIGLSRWVRPDEGEHPYREMFIPYGGYEISPSDLDRLNISGQVHADNMQKYAFIPYEGKIVMVLAVDVALDKDKLIFTKAGETAALVETVTPANALIKDVTWSSSDKSVAVVDADGVVTAVGEGEAVITVTTVSPYNATASCKVTVGMAEEPDKEENPPDGPNPPKEPEKPEDIGDTSGTGREDEDKEEGGKEAENREDSDGSVDTANQTGGFTTAGANIAGQARVSVNNEASTEIVQTTQNSQPAQNPQTGSHIFWLFAAAAASALGMVVLTVIQLRRKKEIREKE